MSLQLETFTGWYQCTLLQQASAVPRTHLLLSKSSSIQHQLAVYEPGGAFIPKLCSAVSHAFPRTATGRHATRQLVTHQGTAHTSFKQVDSCQVSRSAVHMSCTVFRELARLQTCQGLVRLLTEAVSLLSCALALACCTDSFLGVCAELPWPPRRHRAWRSNVSWWPSR